MNQKRLFFLFLLALSLLAGCGIVSSAKSKLGIATPHAALRHLTVSADPGANQGSATQLDIVVYAVSASAILPMNGPDWFRQRAALQMALAEDIEVVSLDVPSPSASFGVKLPRKTSKKAVAVIVFANYVAPEGWSLITLTPYSDVALRLQESSITVSGK